MPRIGPRSQNRGSVAGTRSRSPLYRRKPVILTAAGFVVTAIVVPIAVNLASDQAKSAITGATPKPTRTAVTIAASRPVTQAPSSGVLVPADPIYGWSLTPITTSNDYVSVTATLDPTQACRNQPGWLFHLRPEQLPPYPVNHDLDGWARVNGGIPESGSYLSLTVQGVNGHTVVIEDFGVHIIRRQAPTPGSAPSLSGGCGGINPDYFRADLDSGSGDYVSTVAVAGDSPDDPTRTIKPVPMPHVVSETDPEVWRLAVTTKQCDCLFLPYFDWTSGGNRGRYEIMNGKNVWEVTAVLPGSVPLYLNGPGEPWALH